MEYNLGMKLLKCAFGVSLGKLLKKEKESTLILLNSCIASRGESFTCIDCFWPWMSSRTVPQAAQGKCIVNCDDEQEVTYQKDKDVPPHLSPWSTCQRFASHPLLDFYWQIHYYVASTERWRGWAPFLLLKQVYSRCWIELPFHWATLPRACIHHSEAPPLSTGSLSQFGHQVHPLKYLLSLPAISGRNGSMAPLAERIWTDVTARWPIKSYNTSTIFYA